MELVITCLCLFYRGHAGNEERDEVVTGQEHDVYATESRSRRCKERDLMLTIFIVLLYLGIKTSLIYKGAAWYSKTKSEFVCF